MLKLNILTLFPQIINSYTSESIIKLAQEKKAVQINTFDLRESGLGTRKVVDDTPYGGGGGMVFRVDVMHDALEKIKKNDPETHIILLSPEGERFTQKKAVELAKLDSVTLISGHYQGYDERIKEYVDEVISIGDFVLTGGEVPALAIIDALTRLQPGVLNPDSLKDETFSDNLTSAPLYTKPESYDGHSVPEELLSGNHAKINEFRQSLRRKI